MGVNYSIGLAKNRQKPRAPFRPESNIDYFLGTDIWLIILMRGERPFYFTNLKAGQGVAEIAEFIIELGGLEKRTSKIIAGEYENLQLNQLQNG